MFDDILSEREKAIILIRRSGKTFKEIGKMYGISGARASVIFNNALRKLRRAHEISKKSPELVRAIKIHGYGWKHLFHLYSVLERNNIEFGWVMMSEDELLEEPRLGMKYVDILATASKMHPLKNRR